ncbi:MAG TPA: single-stranded-DNA-specific exonuclease RecJ [Planctomycetota bacterium]|nr:single-stranded-DNA-specific exonuclease RecJ [Planctomycetota bacterium]
MRRPPAFAPKAVDSDAAFALGRSLGLHPVTAQVLAGRGIVEEGEARRFLRPGPETLRDPLLMKDMDRATAAVARTIDAGGRIAVYGDYDVDGVCGTALLLRALQALGADAKGFIPHRVADGYGLRADALRRLREEGCTLVVTVDNGTTRAAEIAEAQAAGLEVVVTDHHEATDELPACPVLNPKRPDSSYPFRGLAGCGVALKLALALAEGMGRLPQASFKALVPDLLALAAVGTVADVVPLVDENRALVSIGLRALAVSKHAGIRALLEVARCAGRPVYARDVGFKIGPRINAAGRIGSAEAALELFLCDDADRAKTLADALETGNRERQRIEREHAEEAMALAERAMAADPPALVLAREGWHPGVIGIVAARVAETFDRPAALVAIENGQGRGSARSFGTVRLHEALERCDAHLLSHGGHAKAAGFTLRAECLDAFREAFLLAVAAQGAAAAGPKPVDAELPIDAITGPLAAELALLEPLGAGNEDPVFCAFDVRAAGEPRRLGPTESQLVFYAATDRSSVRATAPFGLFPEEALKGRFDISFVVRKREGSGEPAEIRIRELVPVPPPA